jgi:hemerythrin-like domain-containing protein
VLRDKNLIPLSHQHQHALALCVRIDRAMQTGDLDMLAWQAEIQQIFVAEIQNHFEAEERELFPAARGFAELAQLVDQLINEHALLRDYFALATERTMDPAKLHDFARKLSAHIRREERELFEVLQKLLAPEELATLGAALAKALEGITTDQPSCAVPKQATRLRSRREIDDRVR